VRNLLRKMNVKMICTTDDPTDRLEWHQKIQDDEFEIRVLPTFRPDKAMQVENIEASLAKLKENGMRLIDERPRIGAEGCLVAFVHPSSTNGVLLELVQTT